MWKVLVAIAVLVGGCGVGSSHSGSQAAAISTTAPSPPAPASTAVASPSITTTVVNTAPASTAPKSISEPPTTPPVVVTLTNPEDLYIALQQAAQQLMGGYDTDQTNIDAFVTWYHQQQSAYQTGGTDIEPPTLQAAAEYWIREYFPTQVEAYGALNGLNAINCMIQSGEPGPCPTSSTTIGSWLPQPPRLGRG